MVFRLAAAATLAGIVAAAPAAGPRAQEDAQERPVLWIELNKVENVDGACHGSFVVTNKLGGPLDRLSLDLYLFDEEGIITQHTVLDMGPVPLNKVRILTFSLVNDRCESISKIVVNDIPNCSVAGGAATDCLAATSVWSKGRISFSL